MRGKWLAIGAALLLSACAPVLNRDLMREGAREFDPRRLLEAPEAFKGRMFIFGGVIVETKLAETGSQIEALFVPVSRYGYLSRTARYQGRFIAVYPRSRGMLDPLVYKKGREVTLAGRFLAVRKGKIDEMDISYPEFEIIQVYLWEEYPDQPYYYYPGYYPYYYRYHPLYDPWWRPYPPPYPTRW